MAVLNRLRFAAPLLLAGACFLTASTPLGATPPRAASEVELKAAFLYNFAKFVDWPGNGVPGENGVYVIGVLGDPVLARQVERAVAGKSAAGHRLVVRSFDDPSELRPTHILFVASPYADRLTAILESLNGHPVLTVGDGSRFAERGGVVGLTTRDNTMGIGINVEAAERAGLQISSKLLRLSTLVGGGR